MKDLAVSARRRFSYFYWRARNPRALRDMPDMIQMSILATFQSKWCWAHIERAQNFGARQWLQNEKLNLFCIYNVFISSKLAEMKAFEVFEILPRNRISWQNSRNRGGAPLK